MVQKLTESSFGILKFGIPIEIWSLMSAGIGCSSDARAVGVQEEEGGEEKEGGGRLFQSKP